VVDTGDGKRTTPITFGEMGINDPNAQAQFSVLEKQAKSEMPDFDLRGDYKIRPQLYQKLMKAMKEGVPDKKNPGKKRQLTKQEIATILSSK
jgi:hypothetical protein